MSNLCIGTNKVNAIRYLSIQEKDEVIVSGSNNTCIRGLAICLSRNQATGNKGCIKANNSKIGCRIEIRTRL